MNFDDTAGTRMIGRVRRKPPPFRRLAVRSTRALTPYLVRVVLGGDELDGFAIKGAASSVRVLFPPTHQIEIEMPTWTGNQFELKDGKRAPIRTFTPRYFDAARNELTLDVVLHDSGVASDWARHAQIDDPVAISGPGRVEPLHDTARSFLLVGDETALPAIGQILEWIQPDRSISVYLEIRCQEARLDLPAHPGVRVTWLDAVPDTVPGTAMIRAVEVLDDVADAVWVAGEASVVQRLRKHLFNDRNLPRSRVTARGYWKSGRVAT